MDDYTPNKEQLTPFEGDVHGKGACEAVEDCLCDRQDEMFLLRYLAVLILLEYWFLGVSC